MRHEHKRKIRKGKDVIIRWSILTNGEPISLEGRDLTLFITDFIGKRQHDFTVEGNTVEFYFAAAEQRCSGQIKLTLFENLGSEGQTAVDSCDAFTLVMTSCAESHGGCEDVEVETVDLETSDMVVGIPGRKGDDGFSPTIKEAESNTFDSYRLVITTKDGEITTPNLMGGGGGSGDGNGGSVNLEEITEDDIDAIFNELNNN